MSVISGIEKDHKNDLTVFDLHNCFQILGDNNKEATFYIVRRNHILKTPKKLLRKCRYCSYKKRSCVLDSFSCNARSKTCSACSKYGHYPQSMNCKAKSKSKSVKRDYENCQLMKRLDRGTQNCIQVRIQQIEKSLKKEDSLVISKSEKQFKDHCNEHSSTDEFKDNRYRFSSPLVETNSISSDEEAVL